MNKYLILILLSSTTTVWANQEYTHADYPETYEDEDPDKRYILVDEPQKFEGQDGGEYYYDDPSQDEQQYYGQESGETRLEGEEEAHPNYIEFQKDRYGEYKQPYQLKISEKEIQAALAKQRKYYGPPDVIHEYIDESEIAPKQRNVIRQPPQQYFKYIDEGKVEEEPINMRPQKPREQYTPKYAESPMEMMPHDRLVKRPPKYTRPQKPQNQDVKYVEYVADHNMQRPPTQIKDHKTKPLQPQRRPITAELPTYRARPSRPKPKLNNVPKPDGQKRNKPTTTKPPEVEKHRPVDVRNSPRRRLKTKKATSPAKEPKMNNEGDQVIYYIDQPVQIYDPKSKQFHQFEKISSKDAEEFKNYSKMK